jgi:hypothetical protein
VALALVYLFALRVCGLTGSVVVSLERNSSTGELVFSGSMHKPRL